MIAVINLDQKNYSKAREYAKKAAATNTSYGQPYILIGQMYAATVKMYFRMTVFWQELPTMWQSTSGEKAKNRLMKAV